MFAAEGSYTWCGKFLRRYKMDELPQLINVLKGEMSLVGPRPEERRTLDAIPEDIKKTILSVKPGCTDLASLYFFDEERLLEGSDDKTRDYWTKIKPIKFVLQAFYVENKCLSLNLWVAWTTFKRILKEIFK
jgi:lipopolysaccharide/colanic/teichoic acid biosynthesis glycosyltransferase